MPGVTPDEGEAQALAVLLGDAPAEDLMLRLYVNEHAPELTDTAADYVEMSTHGYLAKMLAPGDWTIEPALAGTNTPARARTAMQTFTVTEAGPPVYVQGYYLQGAVTGTLYVAEAAPAPIKAENTGDEIGVRPSLRLRSEYPL